MIRHVQLHQDIPLMMLSHLFGGSAIVLVEVSYLVSPRMVEMKVIAVEQYGDVKNLIAKKGPLAREASRP